LALGIGATTAIFTAARVDPMESFAL